MKTRQLSSRKRFTVSAALIFSAVFIATQSLIPLALADGPLSASEQEAEQNWPLWAADSGGCDSSDAASQQQSANGTGTQSTVDITSIVQKYGLQSAIIRNLSDGSIIASYQADQPPTTPASTMKLIIADTALRSGLDLSKSVRVTSDVYYNGQNDLGSSTVTLAQALSAMLTVSSNTGANVLMRAMGGVDGFTQKANGYGYTHTTVKGYYDSTNDGKNSSTISDETAAMVHIFSTNGDDYQTAQMALENASQGNDNHYGVVDDANKWAGTSDVAGNVGKFTVGNESYVIGLYINKSDTDPSAIAAVKNGSADLANAIQSGSTAPSTDQSQSSSACCSGSDGGSDAGDDYDNSNGSSSGSWNSGLQPPYILEQWAIQTLEDLAQKKGVDQTSAVTQQHVIALVAAAIGEGGDIQNSDLFNPLNTGIDNPDLIAGNPSGSGVQSFKSFDDGVEAAAESFAESGYSRLATALLKPSSTAQQFMYALSNNWRYGQEWAGASNPSDPKYDKNYYTEKLQLIKQVEDNYSGTAGLIIGTPALEQAENLTDASKLQFNGSGGSAGVQAASGTAGATDDTSCGDSGGAGSASESSIVQEALALSWPDETHGTTPTPAYAQAYAQYDSGGAGVADCGSFVGTVMHASGADKNYPSSGTAAQAAYVESHPDLYDVVDKVDSINDLQPGDILIVNQGSGEGAEGHTYIYVGSQSPNGYNEASASLGTRAAGLGMAVLSDSRGNYIRARLK